MIENNRLITVSVPEPTKVLILLDTVSAEDLARGLSHYSQYLAGTNRRDVAARFKHLSERIYIDGKLR